MENLPPDFRAKYEQLRTVIDPLSQKPVADYLGGSYWGFTNYDNGARRFNFDNGDIASYDHSGRYPIVCIYGPIFKFYDKLGGPTTSALGRPLSDIRDLPDGSRCAVFESGHLHQWADKVEPFPENQCTAYYQPPPPPFPFDIGPNQLPIPILRKWQELSFQRDPILGTTIAEILGPIYWSNVFDIDVGGKRMTFTGGEIVVYDAGAFGVYGPIAKYWTGVDGGWGRPLTDEQDLQDGGRCVVFEGGHIHRYGDRAGPVAPDRCTARYRPYPRPGLRFNGMPPFFQQKWSQLILVNNHLTQNPIALDLGDLEGGPHDYRSGKAGQTFNFGNGYLATLSNDTNPPPPGTPLELTPPFAVYGAPCKFWADADADNSKYGRPICDQQALPDGGRCNIFEGGHIHVYNGVAGDVPASECRAAYQPTPPPKHTLPFSPGQSFVPPAQSYPQTYYQGSSSPPQSYGGSQYPPSSPPSQGYSPQPPPQTHSQSQQSYMPSQHSISQLTSTFSHLQHAIPHHSQSQQSSSPQPSFSPSQLPFFNSDSQSQPAPQSMNFQPPQTVNFTPVGNNTNANTTLGKPAGLIAGLIFAVLGWNIEESKGDDDCCCCCCCCCCGDD